MVNGNGEHVRPFTIYHSPFTTHPPGEYVRPFTIYHSSFTTHPPSEYVRPFTIYHSPFTIHHLCKFAAGSRGFCEHTEFHQRFGTSYRYQHIAALDYRFATRIKNQFTTAAANAHDHYFKLGAYVGVSEFASSQDRCLIDFQLLKCQAEFIGGNGIQEIIDRGFCKSDGHAMSADNGWRNHSIRACSN